MQISELAGLILEIALFVVVLCVGIIGTAICFIVGDWVRAIISLALLLVWVILMGRRI